MAIRDGLLLCACSIAALSSGQALAQDAPAAPATEQAAAPSNTAGVQDIVVSARRRNETLQNTPVAITAISPAQIESTRATTLSDLQGYAPNVLISSNATGASAGNISIRGIAFADVDKSFDPAVGVVLDGVYMGTSTGQVLDFFDIQSIEVLRGPQGTLFGRNTIGGVINVRRTLPTLDWGGKFEASAGSYGEMELRGVLNVPIIKDVFGVKLFEMHTQGDGYYRNALNGKNVGGTNNDNFGAAFLLKPSSSFSALLTLEQQSQRFQPVTGSLTEPGDAFCALVPVGACGRNNTTDSYTVFDKTNYYGRYRARAATLELNLTAGPVKLTSITSYRNSNETQEQDYGTGGVYDGLRFQQYHQISEEFRASGNIFKGLDYVAGLYYFDSQYHLYQITTVLGSPGYQDTTGKSRSEAAFVDLNWEILPKVRLSGGGRFTHDEKQNINPLLYAGAAKKSWSRFTPKITLDYRPTDTLMLYATWSQGYRSGGFSGRGLTPVSATTPYDQENVNVYEAGLKSEFFDRKVALNLAGFYTDYKNMQESTTIVNSASNTGNETLVVNAAGAHIKGIEADLTARPTRHFTITGSFGYTDANFHGFVVNQPYLATVRTYDFSKVDLIYAPKVTASIAGDYKIEVSEKTTLNLHADYRFISSFDQQIAPDPATPIPATGTIVVLRNDPRLRSDKQNNINLSATFEWAMNGSGAKAHATAFVRNALNDRGTNSAFTVGSFPTLWGFSSAREPRIIGAQFGFQF